VLVCRTEAAPPRHLVAQVPVRVLGRLRGCLSPIRHIQPARQAVSIEHARSVP
jgi:hypothetical protein